MAKVKRLNRAKTQQAEYFTGERSPTEEVTDQQGGELVAQDNAVLLCADGHDAPTGGWSKRMQSMPGLWILVHSYLWSGKGWGFVLSTAGSWLTAVMSRH